VIKLELQVVAAESLLAWNVTGNIGSKARDEFEDSLRAVQATKRRLELARTIFEKFIGSPRVNML
jgi:hypothetical protein